VFGALVVMASVSVICSQGLRAVGRAARASLDAGAHAGGGQAPQDHGDDRAQGKPHVRGSGRRRRSLRVGRFAALIAAFMVMRAFGIGPVGSLFARESNQRDVVLVTDFGVSRAASSVASVAAEGVARKPRLTVITLFNPANVAASLKRMQLPSTSK
jgi:hypothetical protein